MILSNSCVLHERYTIQSVLGEVGPFDVNYLAWDLKDEKEVVIREYYPVRLAKRAADGMLLEVHDAGLFEYGLGAYTAEGILLNKLEHDYIAGCQEQFKQNGTVYCVHNFISGAPLGAYLKQQEGKLSEEEALPLIEKVLRALQAGHERKVYHGGVSPQSILVDAKGEPTLLGFQTARFKLARECKSLKDIIKPGYSAPEQTTYESEEGPWWDIYGCAATIYHMLTGEDLPAATDGWSSSKIKVALYQDALLTSEMSDVLAVALSYSEFDRPASISEFRNMLLQTQKITHQLHAGDGAPQFEIGYNAEVAPQETVWQNGEEVTAAKIKMETEIAPIPVPLVGENEVVEREMPHVIPTSPTQILQAEEVRDMQPDETQNLRSSGREKELELLLTKMVKWQQFFVAFLLGIVVIVLLGIVGGVFFGPALFQQSVSSSTPQLAESLVTPPETGQPETGQPETGEANEAATAIQMLSAIQGTLPAEEGILPAEEAVTEASFFVPLTTDSTHESAPIIEQELVPLFEIAQAEEESRPVEQTTPPVPELELKIPESAPISTDSTSLGLGITESNNPTPVEENDTNTGEGVFSIDENLGLSTEVLLDETDMTPGPDTTGAVQEIINVQEINNEKDRESELESLFIYYRVQGDSLMNQGFTTAALQWYETALKYKPTDTYVNEQILMIMESINSAEREIKAQDSLQARFELARDKSGIFLAPDTPVVLIDKEKLHESIEYPVAAANAGISGRVILRYVVDEQGKIQDINVVKGLGWGMEGVLIDLLKKAQYQPATFNGKPVKAWATFTTVFKLRNR